MYYALACEVIEHNRTLGLVSLALVAEDERALYVQNSSFDFMQGDQDTLAPWATYEEIGSIVRAFLKQDIDPTPQFWAYYGAHDFVAFCQVLGPCRPSSFPPYFNELRQALDAQGKYECTPPIEPRHALDRARWVKHIVAEMIYPEDL